MAKKQSHKVRNGIIAVVLGGIAASLAAVFSNKTARTAVIKEVKKVERKVVKKKKK